MNKSISLKQDTFDTVKTDPFVLEIIRNYLTTTCEEMGTTMMRTSFSPIFNEARDFIVVLFDADVELLAQVDYVPAMLGSARHGVKLALHEVGIENLEPGDVIITNDPYRSNNHIPEHILVKPIFKNDQIVGYAGSIAHMVDVGGTVPAAFGIHENCFQEGMRIAPVKLFKRNEQQDDILKLILANTRTPEFSYGDFMAMVGALGRGEKRIHDLIDRYGLDTYLQACLDMKTVSERLMRKQIAEWPDGVYAVDDCFESDGVTPNRNWQLKSKVVIRGEEVIIDLTGSDEPANGSMAMNYGSSSSAGYEAVFQMADRDIPINEGCYRCITVISPYGSLTNVNYPHATMAGNTEGQPVLIDMLLRGFAQFSEDAPAPDGNCCGLLALGGIDERTNLPFAFLNLEGTGWGGSKYADGNSVQFSKLANCSTQSIEVVETRYPITHVSFEIQPFRGGAGEHRGGFGSKRVMRVYGKELVASSSISRCTMPAPGLNGGSSSSVNVIAFKSPSDADWRLATDKFGTVAPGLFSNAPLKPEDEVMIITGNGAGYGSPFDRDADAVLSDVADELLSVDQAKDEFGVVIENGRVDVSATAALRKEMKSSLEGAVS
ncbi:MAG: hydantoinase B/oxoprolinase family protein [Roseovarius sp.]